MATYDFNLSFLDIGGVTSHAKGSVVGTDVANATTKIQGIAEALQDPDPAGDASEPALTLGALTGASIVIPLSIAGWALNATPAAGSENQKGGRFIFNTASGFPTQITVPTFNEFYKLSSGYLGHVDDFVGLYNFVQTAMIAGGASDGRGSDITALLKSYFTYSGRPAYK